MIHDWLNSDMLNAVYDGLADAAEVLTLLQNKVGNDNMSGYITKLQVLKSADKLGIERHWSRVASRRRVWPSLKISNCWLINLFTGSLG